MLTIETPSRSHDCGGGSRRDFIRIGAMTLGGLSLGSVMDVRASAAAFVKNKSIVLVYLSGGASQIETFDPKMTAPDGVRSVTGEVPTSIAGVTFGGTFDRLAGCAEKLAVVRSFGHDVNSHVEAHVHMLSGGTDPRGQQKQGFSMGSLCSRLRGANHPETGMPTHALLTEEEIDRQYRKEAERVAKGSWPGDLGMLHSPLMHQVGWRSANDNPQPTTNKNSLAADMRLRLPSGDFEDRLSLLRSIDRLKKKAEADSQLSSHSKYSQQAVDLVLGSAAAAFDLSREEPRTIERYDTSGIRIGHHRFRPSTLGKQLLIARRLCESGCGFVTVHSAGWDMHADGNNPGMVRGMAMLGRSLDIAVSAFVEDVAARGLAEDILLVVTGDFGRSPKLNSRGGRDHWSRLSPLAFAGGGLQMGQVIGASTRGAEEPLGDRYTTTDLMATILHVLFDVSKLRLEAGIPRDVSALFDSGVPIRELF